MKRRSEFPDLTYANIKTTLGHEIIVASHVGYGKLKRLAYVPLSKTYFVYCQYELVLKTKIVGLALSMYNKL